MPYQTMMQANKVASCCSEDGVDMVFRGATIHATVRSSTIETVLVQRFSNPGRRTIEAVYNFPLPADAVLLSLRLILNGKAYNGTVLEATKASERYEDAITDGDTPIMLEQVSDNFYCLNLGNLQPGDQVEIETRYSQLLHWQGNQLRLMIPTTLAPRYGRHEDLGLRPEQVIEPSLGVEYQAELSVTIEGELAREGISSPSHEIILERSPDHAEVKGFRGCIAMDRDFILLIEARNKIPATAFYDRDLNGEWVAWLSLVPEMEKGQHTPRHLKIVVDCSGSMGGDSIAQAKIALREIIESLMPGDYFNIIRFGGVAEALFKTSHMLTNETRLQALNWIARIDADMGGTEMRSALMLAYGNEDLREASVQPDLLLITDGQVNAVDAIVKQAVKSGHRHFTVGVGSSVSEDLVRSLAEKTQGACELVSPNENMAAAIVRHANRTAGLRLTQARIEWPNNSRPMEQTPLDRVYSEDTVHCFARLRNKPDDKVMVMLGFGDKTWVEKLECLPFSPAVGEEQPRLASLTLARMAAAQRMRNSQDKAARIKTGVDYQLQSSETNYLVVAERDNKDETPTGPELVKVPGMMPAGWGGMGIVENSMRLCREDKDLVNQMCNSYASVERMPRGLNRIHSARESIPIDGLLDFDDFGDSKSLVDAEKRGIKPDPSMITKVMDLIFNLSARGLLGSHLVLADLQRDLPDELYDELAALVPDFPDEESLVIVFLYNVVEIEIFKKTMSKEDRRTITKTWKLWKKNQHISDEFSNKLCSKITDHLGL